MSRDEEIMEVVDCRSKRDEEIMGVVDVKR